MKRDWLTLAWILGVMVGISSFFSCYLVYEHVMLQRDIQNNAQRISQSTQMQGALQNLVQDLTIYGQKQPAVAPLLRKYGIPVPQPSPPPAK